MYKLFYAPDSASLGVQTILEELKVPYELIPSTINRNEPSPPEQLKINPNGWVPVLTWDTDELSDEASSDSDDPKNAAMYECAAITLFLCDKHSEASLAPSIDEASRPLFLQTLVYFSNSIQNAFQLCYYPDRFANTPADEKSAQQRGIRRLRETWKVIDDQIGNNRWLLGDDFSAADIYLHMLTTWLQTDLGHPSIGEFTNVKRIADKVAQRPSVQFVYRASSSK